MQETNMKQVVTDLVGEEVRSGRVIKNADVLRYLPELAEAIHVDKMKLKGKIRDSLLEEGTYNPLNVILGIIGFRIVSEDGMADRVVSYKSTQDKLDSFLLVDEEKFREALARISGQLQVSEQEERDLEASVNERIMQMSLNLENVTNELNESRQELDYLRQSVAEQVQFMMADCGSAQRESGTGQGLEYILGALDVEAVWEAEQEAGMFTILKTEHPEQCRNKPCMMHEGKVLVKGLRFVSAAQE